MERVARESYGRLLAHLAAAWRDVASAEDALAEAFETALKFWPERARRRIRPHGWRRPRAETCSIWRAGVALRRDPRTM